MKQDLLRQRRNLIAISAFLVVFDIASVQVAKVSLLGNELIIGNVQVLIYCAWCLWGYFFLRYYQYWRAEPEQYIKEAFTSYVKALILRHVIVRKGNDLFNLGYTIERTGLLILSISTPEHDPVTGEKMEKKTFSLPLWRLLSWYVRSALHIVLQTPLATDRVLPFAVAIAAPILLVLRKCPPPWTWP
jgi:hypothetical protein